jgi:hypothetical protein
MELGQGIESISKGQISSSSISLSADLSKASSKQLTDTSGHGNPYRSGRGRCIPVLLKLCHAPSS